MTPTTTTTTNTMTNSNPELTKDEASRVFLDFVAYDFSIMNFHTTTMEELGELAEDRPHLAKAIEVLGDDVHKYTFSSTISLYDNSVTTPELRVTEHGKPGLPIVGERLAQAQLLDRLDDPETMRIPCQYIKEVDDKYILSKIPRDVLAMLGEEDGSGFYVPKNKRELFFTKGFVSYVIGDTSIKVEFD